MPFLCCVITANEFASDYVGGEKHGFLLDVLLAIKKVPRRAPFMLHRQCTRLLLLPRCGCRCSIDLGNQGAGVP